MVVSIHSHFFGVGSAYFVEDLCDLIQESPELYLDEIGEWLALYHEVQISATALHDNLSELGLTRKLMCHAAAERDHELRANWMYNILNIYTAEVRTDGHSR